MTHKDWNRRENYRIRIAPTYPDVFDTIIVGGGPAGMTAAVYAARRKMSTLFVTNNMGGQLSWSTDIRNWTGVIHSTGPILAEQMMSHVKAYRFDRGEFDLFLKEKTKATQLVPVKGAGDTPLYEIHTDTGEVFRTRTVILAVGKRARLLGIPGEKLAQRGNGLSFSATSDAPLYRNKPVVVIGGGNSAMGVALQLEKLTPEITLMTNLPNLKGETILMHQIEHKSAIRVLYNVDVQEILLDDRPWVKGVRYTDAQGKDQVHPCQGVFESVGRIPSTTWLKGVIDLNERGCIVTDRNSHTSLPGVYAGGDCTDIKQNQAIVAAGHGAICALEAHEWVQKYS